MCGLITLKEGKNKKTFQLPLKYTIYLKNAISNILYFGCNKDLVSTTVFNSLEDSCGFWDCKAIVEFLMRVIEKFGIDKKIGSKKAKTEERPGGDPYTTITTTVFGTEKTNITHILIYEAYLDKAEHKIYAKGLVSDTSVSFFDDEEASLGEIMFARGNSFVKSSSRKIAEEIQQMWDNYLEELKATREGLKLRDDYEYRKALECFKEALRLNLCNKMAREGKRTCEFMFTKTKVPYVPSEGEAKRLGEIIPVESLMPAEDPEYAKLQDKLKKARTPWEKKKTLDDMANIALKHSAKTSSDDLKRATEDLNQTIRFALDRVKKGGDKFKEFKETKEKIERWSFGLFCYKGTPPQLGPLKLKQEKIKELKKKLGIDL